MQWTEVYFVPLPTQSLHNGAGSQALWQDQDPPFVSSLHFLHASLLQPIDQKGSKVIKYLGYAIATVDPYERLQDKIYFKCSTGNLEGKKPSSHSAVFNFIFLNIKSNYT